MSNWEKSLIGTVLADPESYEAAADLIPSDFTGGNVVVWGEIMALAQRGGLDPRALCNALGNSPDSERVRSQVGEIENYVAECYQMRGSAIGEFAGQVLSASVKRSLKRAAALIAAEVDGAEKDTDDLLDFAEKKILALRRNRSDEGMTMAQLYGMFIPRLEGMRNGTIKPAWRPNLAAIRRYVPYFEEAEYALLASRPGGGKSSILRYEFLMTAKEGKPVTIYNYENDPSEYARHFLAMETGINSSLLKEPRRLTPEQLAQVKAAAERLARLPLLLVNAAGWNAGQVLRHQRKDANQRDTKLMGVDYVQLINNGREKKNDDIELTSQSLRANALALGVPQYNASQLNRDIERGNADREPQLADLRGSGSLEQDASIVVFPRSPWETNPEAGVLGKFPENIFQRDNGTREYYPVCIPIKFYVLKNRNGSIGISDLVKWNRSTNTFTALPPDWH